LVGKIEGVVRMGKYDSMPIEGEKLTKGRLTLLERRCNRGRQQEFSVSVRADGFRKRTRKNGKSTF